MSTIHRLVIAATLSDNRDKIALRFPFDRDILEFVHSLPAARWNQPEKAWTCDATPAAAWRLMNEFPDAVDADDGVLRLSTLFVDAMAASRRQAGQPAVRRRESWKHQLEGYAFAAAMPAAMLAMAMGTGKSKVVVDLVCNMSGGPAVLIVCPVSVRAVWRREFETHAGRPCNVIVLENGSVKTKQQAAEKFLSLAAIQSPNGPRVVVVNYETAKREPFDEWSCSRRWAMAVLDESHRAKGYNSDTGKYVEKLGRVADKRLCLSGTPMPHSPLDLFAQFRFLDRGLFGSSYHHFRNRYARMNEMFPGKVDAWLNQDELAERAGLLTYQVGADALDLPPVQHHDRRFTLGTKAATFYRELQEELIAEVQGGTVTAANALVKLLRLAQVTSGYTVEDETEKVHSLDDGKEQLLADLLYDLPEREPVVVFCRFKYDLAAIRRVTETLGRRYAELSGSRKDGLTDRATMAPDCDVVGVQIQSGGVGIDLTRARYCVYYSPNWSLGDYEQSMARVHRPGQTRPASYYHLIASETVDDVVYRALRARKELVQAVIEGMKK